MRRPVLFSFTALAFLVNSAAEADPLAAWVQVGEAAEVRALTEENECPLLLRDGMALRMELRAPESPHFPALCSSPIPDGTQSLTLNGHNLPLPRRQPERILIVGDTGCRIARGQTQACNDPAAWVFPGLAAAAAAQKPDLIVHVGDYVSREAACPAAFSGCENSPFGDNWQTWSADFFSPAKPLLAVAPVVLARGNHEDCSRQGLGWLRLMGQARFEAGADCKPHTAPFTVPLGSLTLAIVDTASAPESATIEPLASAYAEDLQSVAHLSAPVWLIQHRPVWGAISGPFDIPIGGNLTLGAAVRSQPIPANVELMLSGHIHGFEAMNYYGGVPPQIIAGHGGDLPHEIPRILKGAIFQGAYDLTVKDGVSSSGFGFVMLQKSSDGWLIESRDADGNLKKLCRLASKRIDCS